MGMRGAGPEPSQELSTLLLPNPDIMLRLKLTCTFPGLRPRLLRQMLLQFTKTAMPRFREL